MTKKIRVRKSDNGAWVYVTILETRPGWVKVDDGNGPLWVMLDHVHPEDR